MYIYLIEACEKKTSSFECNQGKAQEAFSEKKKISDKREMLDRYNREREKINCRNTRLIHGRIIYVTQITKTHSTKYRNYCYFHLMQ